MRSPTQRSLELMRSRGFTAEVTEHFNHFSKRRNDLMGFCDILCLGITRAVAVQTTSGSNVSSRVKKIATEPRAKLWLQCGGDIEVHGWRKIGKRGERKTWQPVVKNITLEDLTKTLSGS